MAAISLNPAGLPIYLKLDLVSGFTAQAIPGWANAWLPASTMVASDVLGCLAGVTDADSVHLPMILGTLKPRDLSEFK